MKGTRLHASSSRPSDGEWIGFVNKTSGRTTDSLQRHPLCRRQCSAHHTVGIASVSRKRLDAVGTAYFDSLTRINFTATPSMGLDRSADVNHTQIYDHRLHRRSC